MKQRESRLKALERRSVPMMVRAFIIDVVRSAPLTYQRTDTGERMNARQFAAFRSRYPESTFIIDDIGGTT